LLLYAARRDHMLRLIRPALDAGRWVVADRFSDSTLAYQGYGRGLPLDDLVALHQIALGDFSPDLTIILDLSVEEGLARAGRRSLITDRFEQLEHEFHQRVREGFLAIAKTNPRRCVVIDAMADVATVHASVLAVVSERLRVKLG